MNLINKYLQRIINEYIEYKILYNDELLSKIRRLYSDTLIWYTYDQYSVFIPLKSKTRHVKITYKYNENYWNTISK